MESPRPDRGILTQVRADRHATDTARFAMLHDAADTLLDELAERYMVDRRETKELLGPDEALVRMVRLMPRTPAAGPLAIAFTDFPGLAVRLGRWWAEALPACGCDDCAEDPAELVETLRVQTSALIEGGLWERVRRGVGGSWFETRLIGVGLRARREGPLTPRDAREARRSGFAAAVQWAPWPRSRPAG
ncbi:hypothetical protein Ari01nite_57550 [Paractinoplanes rishiriensis]|uniref:Uncharacterized protein n=1 Tax=Paractinoplanes rishiriensis TaxID=1050105 RepID=A0A919K3H0_9ACTN|nr:hypothetical protein Ari01nite_57550 [Actinoplanes rishiriensis]